MKEKILFSDPCEKRTGLIRGELCIYCTDDSNHSKNKFAYVEEVNEVVGEDVYFTLSLWEVKNGVWGFSEDYTITVSQWLIIFIPWETDLEIKNFMKKNKDLCEAVFNKRGESQRDEKILVDLDEYLDLLSFEILRRSCPDKSFESVRSKMATEIREERKDDIYPGDVRFCQCKK